MKNNRIILGYAYILFLLFFSSFVLAAENDLKIQSGIEVDNIITIVSSLLATALFIITLIAYKRSGNKKLVFVSSAFLLFAVKGFLIASDIFIPNKGSWVDPTANFLDFAILLSFFFGVLKK